jgi:RND family efflux transporter MFP subunit
MVRLVLPLLVIAGASAYAYWLILTKHRPERRPAQERATVVETVAVQRQSHQITVRRTGFVTSARRITLQPRVGSEVLAVSPKFVPGGTFEAGEIIVSLDPTDFELELANFQSEVSRAEYDYQLELGSQDIARHEWALIDDNESATELEQSLALRVPHLAKAEAALEGARARLRGAELDLARTEVEAPFNCVVVQRNVNVGAQVTPQTVLAELVDTDEFWVEVTLPYDQLKWVTFPDAPGEKGGRVLVTPPAGVNAVAEWEGWVIQQRVDLEEKGRLAQILVTVPHPMDKPEGVVREVPLLLGALVEVQIFGPVMEDVFVLPQTDVHEGRWIWVMSPDSRLQIREVQKVWEDRDVVLTRTGLKEGEQLVTTDIGAPVEGMLLRLPKSMNGQAASNTDAGKAGPGKGEGRR